MAKASARKTTRSRSKQEASQLYHKNHRITTDGIQDAPDISVHSDLHAFPHSPHFIPTSYPNAGSHVVPHSHACMHACQCQSSSRRRKREEGMGPKQKQKKKRILRLRVTITRAHELTLPGIQSIRARCRTCFPLALQSLGSVRPVSSVCSWHHILDQTALVALDKQVDHAWPANVWLGNVHEHTSPMARGRCAAARSTAVRCTALHCTALHWKGWTERVQ